MLCEISCHLKGIDDDQVDLRREIAYNLSLIYQSSGNKEMARNVIYTYCTVWLNEPSDSQVPFTNVQNIHYFYCIFFSIN